MIYSNVYLLLFIYFSPILNDQNLRPDPVDFQMIRFSNCLQITTLCIKFISKFAVFTGPFAECLEYAPCGFDIFAVIVEKTVEGCIGAQVIDIYYV